MFTWVVICLKAALIQVMAISCHLVMCLVTGGLKVNYISNVNVSVADSWYLIRPASKLLRVLIIASPL